MRDGGRIAAALAVLDDIELRHRPARLALKTWGEAARYAGSKDRAFVAGLVLDALRHRRSAAWRMDGQDARASALGVLSCLWNWPFERIAEACADAHGPGPLTDGEAARLKEPVGLATAPVAVRGDYPDWLTDTLESIYGEAAALEGQALADRAPIDLRVNTLKCDPERALKALDPFGAIRLDALPTALRIPGPAPDHRAPPVESLPEFAKGWFEIQDLGSQMAADAAGEIAHKQVLDFCAGGGGKTLALAAAMANTGQLFAYDADVRRLADTQRRAQRAGVRNLQVRSPLRPNPLADLSARMDVVFVDAPCTGSGVWRRHPDAKWRLKPAQLERRMAEQDAVLGAASEFVKPGGTLIYVTCSLFREENEDRIAAFLAAHGIFSQRQPARRLTPRVDGTDGFFIARLGRDPGAILG